MILPIAPPPTRAGGAFHVCKRGTQRSVANAEPTLVLGWLASIVMRTDAQQGIFLNIVVGIVGAMLGGFLLGPLLGGGSITNGISAGSLVVSFLGALILLAIVNLVRRGSVR